MSSPPAATPADWLRLLRWHHGVKNLFVLAAPFFGGRLLEVGLWLPLFWALLAFSLCASGVYAGNDAADRDSDRRHPRKRLRPVAAGKIRPRHATLAAAGLAVGGLGLAAALCPPPVVPLLVTYLVLNLIYSGEAKNWPVLDLLFIASGFVLRVLVGAAATATPVSAWLLACVIASTLFLAAAKRRSERSALDNPAPGLFHHRPVLAAYPPRLLEACCWLFATTALGVYASYAWTEKSPVVALLTVPLAGAGLLRYGLLTRPGATHQASGENPELLLWKDPLLAGLILAWGTILAVGIYLD